ncbi:MAG TPA: glycosyltransferase, partial [Alphaproteobacteria bacterium]|nr:glycosyltransferase [Alphaproteobacteria bacterium]
TAGRPAILVPYPFARDDHQTLNAAILADAGAAWSMAQPDFTPGALVSRLGQLLAEPETLADAAARALRLGRPDAAARLADLVERLARGAPVALERAS